MLIVVLIGLNAFFAASEMAIISVKKTRIQHMQENGNKQADTIKKLVDEPSRFLATIQVGVTLAGFLASASAASSISHKLAKFLEGLNIPLLVQASQGISLVLVTIVLSFFTLVLGELVPKRLALQRSEAIALRVAGPIQVLSQAAAPFIKLLTWITNLLVRLMGGNHQHTGTKVTEEEIRLMIDVGQEEGVFQETETEMINSIFEFDNTSVREVMTPRIDIVGLPVNASLDEIIEMVTREKYSRIPVYRDSMDYVVGILYTKDLLSLLRGMKEDFSLRDVMRDPYFVPESKKINQLFIEFKQMKNHMAVVIDEYGGTAGLVTIEDLLEEIVGNIQDEYDDEDVDFEMKGSNVIVVNGMLMIDEVNDIFNVEIPEDEWETIGGFVMGLIGTVPSKGDEVQYEGMIFNILEMDDKRIARLKITKEKRTNHRRED